MTDNYPRDRERTTRDRRLLRVKRSLSERSTARTLMIRLTPWRRVIRMTRSRSPRRMMTRMMRKMMMWSPMRNFGN